MVAVPEDDRVREHRDHRGEGVVDPQRQPGVGEPGLEAREAEVPDLSAEAHERRVQVDAARRELARGKDLTERLVLRAEARQRRRQPRRVDAQRRRGDDGEGLAHR